MYHRIISILLIGTILSGGSFCCCSMKVLSTAAVASNFGCCQRPEAQPTRPANSGDEHKCPCREHGAIVALMAVGQMLPTGSSTNSIVDHSYGSSLVCGSLADVVSPHGLRRLQEKAEPWPSGTALLIAFCVRRC